VTVTAMGPLADIEGELSRAWIATGAALLGHVRHTDARFDAVDRRFDQVDARFDQVEARLDRVESRLGGVETRLGRVETDLKALQGQVNRLEISNNERFDRLDGRIEYLVGLIIRSETKGQESPAATDG
jgi:septal ring factor EnvC (AmiA/AmiB activator)